jgi:hypothetical protein
VAADEILVSVDVAVPLAAIGSVLVNLVFDNDLESQIDKIDSSDRTVVAPMTTLHSGGGRSASTRHSRR